MLKKLLITALKAIGVVVFAFVATAIALPFIDAYAFIIFVGIILASFLWSKYGGKKESEKPNARPDSDLSESGGQPQDSAIAAANQAASQSAAALANPETDPSSPPETKKCPHCAESIKAEAKICRYCNKEQPNPPVPLSANLFALAFMTLIIGGIIWAVVSISSFVASLPDTPSAPRDPIKSQFSRFDGSHRKLENFIQTQMNDPDSYEHVKTGRWGHQGTEDYYLVRTTFRGKNAFGGMIINSVTAKVRKSDGAVLEITDWE